MTSDQINDSLGQSLVRQQPENNVNCLTKYSGSTRQIKLIREISLRSLGRQGGECLPLSIIDLEVGESGGILAILDNDGLLTARSLKTNEVLLSAQISMLPLREFIATRPSPCSIRRRYYFTCKKRHNYNFEDIIDRISQKLSDGIELAPGELKTLEILVFSQATRIFISQSEDYLFVFDGSNIFTYSIKEGKLVAHAEFMYSDFSVDKVNCVAYILRKDGLFSIDLITCKITHHQRLPSSEGRQVMPGSIKLDHMNRYLAISYVEIDISKLPFGSFYSNEFFLSEVDLCRLLAEKGISMMLKYGANPDSLSFDKNSLELAVNESLSPPALVIYDTANMTLVAESEIMTSPIDSRMAPAYSALFDAFFFVDSRTHGIVQQTPNGGIANILNCFPPSVNFEIEVVDEFLVILDNNKRTGTDMVILSSLRDHSNQIAFDTMCDVYTNLRANENMRLLVAGCSDGCLRLIDLVSLDESFCHTPHANGVQVISSLTGSGIIASAGENMEVAIWQVVD